MQSVKKGGNRQELHERLRTHSHGAAAKVKLEGGANDLIQRIVDDPAFPLTEEEIYAELDPKRYIGRCASQVEDWWLIPSSPFCSGGMTAKPGRIEGLKI